MTHTVKVKVTKERPKNNFLHWIEGTGWWASIYKNGQAVGAYGRSEKKAIKKVVSNYKRENWKELNSFYVEVSVD